MTNTKTQRPIATSIRIPAELVPDITRLQKEQHCDRSSIIIQALSYWVSVSGKATADGEYMHRLENLEGTCSGMADTMKKQEKELSELRKIIADQNTMIDKLLDRLPKQK